MTDTVSEEAMARSAGSEEPSGGLGETGGAKPKNERKGRFLGLLTAALISVAISISSVLVYDRYFATRIAAVDIKGFIAEQRDLYVQGKISEEQLRRNIESLDRTMQKIPANVVVIMGDAVVRNAEVIKP